MKSNNYNLITCTYDALTHKLQNKQVDFISGPLFSDALNKAEYIALAGIGGNPYTELMEDVTIDLEEWLLKVHVPALGIKILFMLTPDKLNRN